VTKMQSTQVTPELLGATTIQEWQRCAAAIAKVLEPGDEVLWFCRATDL
jgi:hypothetical protein